jgi:hypothetical protein
VSQRSIRAAFESRLASFATARGLSVAWENISFDEPEALYLRAAMLPAPTTSDDLAGVHRGYRGALQVLIVAPIHIGAGEALNHADALADHFPVNLALTSGGVTVRVTRPASIAPALQSETRYTVPVTIFYRADTI